MCGFIGIYGSKAIAPEIYDGLIVLQHRGQDAAGITTFDGNRYHLKKGAGLVRDIYDQENMMRLKGSIGIGHVRYPTCGDTGGVENAQPFILYSPYGIMMAHNGNVTNFEEMKKELFETDQALVNSSCDSELILHVLASAFHKQKLTTQLKPSQVFKAVKEVYKRVTGSYSVVGHIAKHGMLGFRDPYGIRPMIFGKRETSLQTEYAFASEKVAFDALGFEVIRDLEAGEAVYIDENRKVHSKVMREKGQSHYPCLFEYIYFARPDSEIDKISVHKARLRQGEALGRDIKKAKLPIDVVIPVPDSSRGAALGVSKVLRVPYREGFIKNRYIGRTFIMPGQAIRKKSIKYKLNPIPFELRKKNVLLVDDSIVRGNTSKKIIEMVREAGAYKVYFASAAPPVTNPCLYGIDIPTRKELIASSLSIPEIQRAIGADALFYPELKTIMEATKSKKSTVKNFCGACFGGGYPTPEVTEELVRKNEECRLKAAETEEDQLTLL